MNRARFQSLFSLQDWPTLLVGLGGLGLPTALTLAKQGVKHITAFDPDFVSEENTGPQLYGDEHVGLMKSYAASLIVDAFSADTWFSVHSCAFPERQDLVFLPGHPHPRVVVSAVDSIAVRREIYEWFAASGCEYMIDVRMGAEDGAVFVVKHGDRQWYEKILYGFGDEDISDLPCTAKATFHTGFGVAAEVGAVYAALARNERCPAYVAMDFARFDKRVLRWLA
jgi:molybdopterin/thiamine biosynthesis adenylyltransferase